MPSSETVFLCCSPVYLLGQFLGSPFQAFFCTMQYPKSLSLRFFLGLLYQHLFFTFFIFCSFPCLLFTMYVLYPPTLLSGCLHFDVKKSLSDYKSYLIFWLCHWISEVTFTITPIRHMSISLLPYSLWIEVVSCPSTSPRWVYDCKSKIQSLCIDLTYT